MVQSELGESGVRSLWAGDDDRRRWCAEDASTAAMGVDVGAARRAKMVWSDGSGGLDGGEEL